MKELCDILEQIILFYEKYDETTTPFGNETLKEFWSTEEMNTCFVMDEHKYYIYQAWHRNLFNSTYNMTIYKNGDETTLDIFFIRTLLANLNQSIH